VVHLDGLDLSGHVARSEGDDHAGLDNTSLNTADGHRANTTDLVHILERETEGLVRGTNRGLDGVDGIEEGLALDDTTLGLLGPALVPGHATRISSVFPYAVCESNDSVLGRLLEHVVTVPAGDGDERDRLGVVADLLDEGGRLLDDLVEAVLGPLYVYISIVRQCQ
jgi:hypothetical protein